MTKWARWVFNGKHVDSYIDPQAEAFKYGTFMYVNEPISDWYRCSPFGPAPKIKGWKPVDEWDVPRHLLAWVLLLE